MSATDLRLDVSDYPTAEDLRYVTMRGSAHRFADSPDPGWEPMLYRVLSADGGHRVEDPSGLPLFYGSKRECFGFVREAKGLGPMPKARA